LKTVLVLTLITSLVQIVGFVIYDLQAFKKMSKPNVATWTIWAGISVLNFMSYRSMSGDWMVSVLPAVSSAFCILTFVVAIAKGGRFSKLDSFDKSALVLGMAAIVAWYILKSATYANLIVQGCVIIGFVPTWRNAYKERSLAWFIWTSAYVLGIILVAMRWTGQWENLVYPGICIFAHLAVGIIAARVEYLHNMQLDLSGGGQ
jgi:hypothetical protein